MNSIELYSPNIHKRYHKKLELITRLVHINDFIHIHRIKSGINFVKITQHTRNKSFAFKTKYILKINNR